MQGCNGEVHRERMGIWDELQSSISRLINRKLPGKSPSESDTFGAKPTTALVSNVTKIADAVKLNGAQKLDEYCPDPHRRDKIGRILTNLGKFAVESAVNESLKGVTGQSPRPLTLYV